MSETPQLDPINQHPHLGNHPDAVRDIEKAHIMAKAADYNETSAAGVRWLANEALIGDEDDYQERLHELKNGYGPQHPESEIPKHYKEAAFVHLDRSDDQPYPGPDEAVGSIKQHQQDADEKYKFVGEAHDKLKATKR
jgi:hypothetical protein